MSAVTLRLAEPLTSAIAAVVLLDERLGALGWAGAATVLIGLLPTGLFLTGLLLTGRSATPRRTIAVSGAPAEPGDWSIRPCTSSLVMGDCDGG